jgi:anthranilate/para-aminobenzoate synthase component I
VTGGPALLRATASQHPRCFWLDRVHPQGWPSLGGHGLLGWLADDDVSISYDATARTVTRHTGNASEVVGDDVWDVLGAEVAAGPDDALWVGYLGYAARTDLPAARGPGLPDALWLRADPRRLQPVTTVPTEPASAPEPGSGALTDEPAYDAAFAAVQEHLRAGDTYEVNLTYRVEVTDHIAPWSAYLALRRRNPAPYAGFLQHDLPGARAWLLSSSPERFAAVGDDRIVETRPIKGTLPRGSTPAEDAALAGRLAGEPKFRAENLMIVDLMRNDLSRVCEPGTVDVPTLMTVESYPSVHQLVSVVTGRLRPEVATVEALHSLFPPGSMTGAPKRRTMEVIESVESSPRGVYSGAFGWLRPDGRADLAVVIRSLTTGGDGRWTLGTGGGVTVRSQAADELEESYAKARALLAALRSR